MTLVKINHGFTTNKTKKTLLLTMVLLLFNHGFCSKTVVIQMVINLPKNTWLLHFYYNKIMVSFHKRRQQNHSLGTDCCQIEILRLIPNVNMK